MDCYFFAPGMNETSIQPLVSIVTIVYNGEKHLEQTIRSVLEQSYSNIEYFIVDGGSTDQTVPLIKKYQPMLAGWISEPDNGISDAFNKGIERTNGSIIGMINADDWYEKDCVARIVSRMHDHDIAYGDVCYWKNGHPIFVQEGNHLLLEKEMTVNHPTVFVKRKCYEQEGRFDVTVRFAMDYDMLLRLYVKGYSFIHVPAVLANMRWEGVSDRHWKKGVKETLGIKNKYLPQKRALHERYYYRHMLAIGIPKFLEKVGLGVIPRVYRSIISRQKKTYIN
jgi:glycosyltransferase involved in cell wall biosynthesis